MLVEAGSMTILGEGEGVNWGEGVKFLVSCSTWAGVNEAVHFRSLEPRAFRSLEPNFIAIYLISGSQK